MTENFDSYQENVSRGNRYLHHEDYQRAKIAFQKAHAKQPNNLQPLFKLVDIHSALKESEEADAIEHLINEIIDKCDLESSSRGFPFHEPYTFIFDYLARKDGLPSTDPVQVLKNRSLELYRIRHELNKSQMDGQSFYDEKRKQEANLLFYYPYYIETIFRELSKIPSPKYPTLNATSQIACLYGCGPAPEYMGLLQYISKEFQSCRELNCYFFDNNDWTTLRSDLINHMKESYCNNQRLITRPIARSANLFDFVDINNVEKYSEIGMADFHVFQNCLRDLMGTGGKEQVIEIMLNIFQNMKNGSILLLIGLPYDEVRRFLLEISNLLCEKCGARSLLLPRFENYYYIPNFEKPEWLSAEFKYLTEKVDRKWTGYYSCAIQKP